MEILVARSDIELGEAYARLRNAGVLGCDTETSGLTARHGELYSVQFSDGDLAVLVPMSEGVGLGPLSGLLVDPSIVKIFHNARFDLGFLNAAGLGVDNIFDTMIAERVLTRGADQSASLAETLYRYFAIDLDKSQRAKFTRKWDGVWTDDLVHYALSDVCHLPQLMREQRRWLLRIGLETEFSDQMSRLTIGDTPDVPL